MTNEFKNYSLFNDVQNPLVRTWNRCSVYLNIMVDRDKVTAQGYLAALDDISVAAMRSMLKLIQEQGSENIKKQVMASI